MEGVDEEAGGVLSHRLIQNHLWEEKEGDNEGHVGKDYMDLLIDWTEEDGHLDATPISFDFRLGNTCNLQCVMCLPQDSSMWLSNDKKLKDILETDAKWDWEHKSKIEW